MLTFFPTPYEDELWYGIITRYHIRSGNTCWKYTIQELFPEIKGYPRLGDTMPNTSMQIIAISSPRGSEDIMQAHGAQIHMKTAQSNT